MRNISVKLFKIHTSVQEEMPLKHFIYRSGCNLVHGSRTISVILVEGITYIRNISVK